MADRQSLGMGMRLALWLFIVAACKRHPAPLALAPPRVVTPAQVPGPPLEAIHYGAPWPARVARSVGGEIWLGTDAGILRFSSTLLTDPAHARPVGVIGAAAGLPSLEVNDLRALADGTVEVATAGGVVRVGRSGKARGGARLAGQRATALSARLIGTWTGLRLRSGARVSPDDLAVTDLLDCDDATYVATHEHGLYLYRSGVLAAVPGVPAGRVARLGGCRDGRTVYAATTKGVFVARGGRAEPVPGWTRHATAVALAGDSLLVGTFGQGVVRLPPGGGPTPLLSSGRVSLVASIAPDVILIGTDEQLLVARGTAEPCEVPLDGPPSGLITALASRDDMLWAGSFDAGLASFDGRRWRRQPLLDPRVTALAHDADGILHVGTARGLLRLDGERLGEIRDPRGWLSRHINAIRSDGPTLYVAAYPGVVVLSRGPDGSARYHYMGAAGQEADAGLSGTTVNGIAPAAAGLWLATQTGLTLLAPAGPRWLTDLSGILPDDWVTDVRAAGDRVYVLTLRSGLLEIGPAEVRLDQFALMTSPSALLPLPGGQGALFGVNGRGLVYLPASPPDALYTFGPAEHLGSPTVAALAYDADEDRLFIGGSSGIDRVEHVSRLLARIKRRSP